MADAAVFNIREPQELSAFRGEGNLERIAAGETEALTTVADDRIGGQLIARRSVVTGLTPQDTGIVAAHARKGRPYAGRPFLVEVVGQRPLPKVGVTEPTVACCWMSCTQLW
jgi:hypothetical protein